MKLPSKLSQHGTELFRYFKGGVLVSVRSDCTTHIRTLGSGWRQRSHKKPEVSFEQWLAGKREIFNSLEPWQRRVTRLPSEAELHRWAVDSVCEATTGEEVEPDAQAHGTVGPSWLVALELI